MGFSVTSSTVILALAAFAAGGTLTTAFMHGWDTVTESYRTEWDRRTDETHTNITITSVSWNPGQKRLTLAIKNTGMTTLDPNDCDFIANGAWVTDKVTSLTVSSATTTVWGPGETLDVQLANAGWSSQPTKVAVWTENGIATFWRS